MDPLTISLIGQAGYGIYQQLNSGKRLADLSKEKKPRYMDAAGEIQQNRAMGEQLYKTGLAPSVEAMMDQSAAAQTAGLYRQATDVSGGQMSSLIGRLGSANLYQLGLQKGSLEQAAKERGMGIMMGANREISGLKRADIGQDISYRERTEQALGTAKQQGAMNVLGALGAYTQGKQYQDYMNYLTSSRTPAAQTTPSMPVQTSPASYQDLVDRIGKMPPALGLPAIAKEGDTAMSGGVMYVYRGGKWQKGL